MKLRGDPDDPNDPQEITISLPVATSAVAFHVDGINSSAVLTQAFVVINSTTFDLLTVIGSGSGFIGFIDDMNAISDFAFISNPNTSSGQGRFPIARD